MAGYVACKLRPLGAELHGKWERLRMPVCTVNPKIMQCVLNKNVPNHTRRIFNNWCDLLAFLVSGFTNVHVSDDI